MLHVSVLSVHQLHHTLWSAVEPRGTTKARLPSSMDSTFSACCHIALMLWCMCISDVFFFSLVFFFGTFVHVSMYLHLSVCACVRDCSSVVMPSLEVSYHFNTLNWFAHLHPVLKPCVRLKHGEVIFIERIMNTINSFWSATYFTQNYISLLTWTWFLIAWFYRNVERPFLIFLFSQ